MIRILLLEDDPRDAELLAARLELDGVPAAITHAADRAAFLDGLARADHDAILSDFDLPGWSGMAALEGARELAPGVPFLFVSGAMGEEIAIETLKRGATDYVLKHRLDRLAPALRRALRERDNERERRRAEAERDALYAAERRARLEAEQANRVKDEFLATVSHELRTPLAAILGWARMLRSGALPPERLDRALEVIERNARLQTQLIEDLLDVSRIVSGKLRIEPAPVAIAELVELSIEAIGPHAQAKSIALTADLDAPGTVVRADAHRLQQAIGNLLTNAVKFTPAGGTIVVSVRAAEPDVVISVEDSGCGIEPDLLPLVFDRFRQGSGGPGGDHGGLGLGLTIVRHIVELHGGSIRAESEGPGKGARFVIRIPAWATTGEAPRVVALARPSLPATLREAPSLRGLRVVVVDDEPDARELLASVLRELEAAVEVTDSADAALAAIRARSPDVLISDLAMPRTDGFSLIRQVRAIGSEARDLGAIALSAHASPDDRARALEEGFDRHLSKPVEPGELAAVVADLARSRGAGS